MKELDFLNIINNTLSVNSYLGNDCAFIDDLDIFVTHDTLVQDVHFSMHNTSPYLLAKKSVAVNLSDLASSLALPKYITVSLSLPKNTDLQFVENFYKGINDICTQYNVKVIGGDITGSDKIVISICAIGKKISLFQAGRNYAKKGDIVVSVGNLGLSSAGLFALKNFLYAPDKLINAHIQPEPLVDFSLKLADIIDSDIASIDTSDGLVDALYKIALASKHSIEIDFEKIPVDNELISFSKQNDLNYKEFIKWGGEDYSLIFCVSPEIYSKLNHDIFIAIGKVQNKDVNPSVIIKDGNSREKITESIYNKKIFNHF